MDTMIQQVISSNLSVFDSFTISDDALIAEIESLKNELNSLGESCSDIMDYMAKYPVSGLQEKYSELMGRASTPSAAPSVGANSAEEKKPDSGALPTVKEFLEQYRESYNTVKDAGYRKRTEKAYENIFAVADRADNLIDMNIILEKEQMLWKIVTEDLLDIYQPIYDATDPLNIGVRTQFRNLIKTCSEVKCDEELTYRLEVENPVNQRFNYSFMSRMLAPLMLANAIMFYDAAKRKFRTWIAPERDLLGVVSQRGCVIKTYEFIKKTWGWDFDYMVNDEWMKLWFIIPVSADANGRLKKTLDPHNIEVYRELLFDDALSDRTIDNILLTEQKMVLYFNLNTRTDEVVAIFDEEAKKRNADLVFFQYLEKLQAAVDAKGIKTPKIEERENDHLNQ